MTVVLCASCGKQCHTRAEAKRHAAGLQRQSWSTRKVTVYKCADWRSHPTAMFHVGHTPRRGRRRGGVL